MTFELNDQDYRRVTHGLNLAAQSTARMATKADKDGNIKAREILVEEVREITALQHKLAHAFNEPKKIK